MSRSIRIGTRNSKLALWQAHQVEVALSENNCETHIHPIVSDGDINLVTPLYETGIQGVFTKALDIALLNNEIDVAVHSYKDVPTALAKGIRVAAVLKRATPHDVLVCRNEKAKNEILSLKPLRIATSSIRRKAQWLHKYPETEIENIRGNIQTRLQKLKESDWHGAIFAAAALKRLNIKEEDSGPQIELNWMLPAPAQGAIVVVCREGDAEVLAACNVLNDFYTEICTTVERTFLREMLGGCSTPISAYAIIENEEVIFKGNITATDGSETISIFRKEKIADYLSIAKIAAEEAKADERVKRILS